MKIITIHLLYSCFIIEFVKGGLAVDRKQNAPQASNHLENGLVKEQNDFSAKNPDNLRKEQSAGERKRNTVAPKSMVDYWEKNFIVPMYFGNDSAPGCHDPAIPLRRRYEPCSGRGRCSSYYGYGSFCECYNKHITGVYCEECPTCQGKCANRLHRDCILCEAFNTGMMVRDDGTCAQICQTDFSVIVQDTVSPNEANGETLCTSTFRNGCYMEYVFGDDANIGSVVRVKRLMDCPVLNNFFSGMPDDDKLVKGLSATFAALLGALGLGFA